MGWELFRGVVDAAPDAILVVDGDGRIIYANRQVMEIFGWSPADLIGEQVERLIPVAVRDRHPSHRRRFAATSQARPMGAGLELHGLRRDGSEVPVEISLSALSTTDGPRAIAVVRDATERRHTEAVLSQLLRDASAAQARFRAVVESAPDATLIVDADGRIVLASKQVEDVFGYPREELIGRHVEVLVPERFRVRHIGHRVGFADDPRARGMGAGAELWGLREDGSEFPIEISLSPLEMAEGAEVIASVRDVTERKRAEAARAMLAALVQGSDDAIYGKDGDGVITSWNDGAERLFGYSADRIVGQHISTLVPEHRSSEADAILARVIDGKHVERYETERLHADGTLLDVAISVSPICDSSGRVIAASAIARDISDQRRTERLKDEFIGIAAHELRTPLSVVLGFAELLEAGWDSREPADLRHLGDLVLKGAREMNELVTRLLDFSQLRAGRVSIFPEPLNVSRQVTACVARLGALLEERVLTVEVPADLGVLADAVSFDRVLSNLVVNAVKYSEEGTRILVSARLDGDQAVVSVTDEGVGIPPQEQDQVFEQFFRSSLTHGTDGTGIGLAVVKAHVDMHGGSVAVESALGVGSTFSFFLAASQAPAA